MKKYSPTVPQKDVIIKLIEIYFPDAKIYLFGSYARGTPRHGSDIDIALDAGRRLTLEGLSMPARLIEALPMAQQVDLVDINRVPPTMRKNILEEGIVWKS